MIESFGDGDAQLVGAVVIEQSQQLGRLACDRFAAFESGGEKALDLRDGMFEAVDGGRTQGFAFECDEVGEMDRIVDPLVTVVAAPVASDLHDAVENPNRGLRGDQRQPLADQGMWDGIVISVVPDIDRLIGVYACDQIGLKRVSREREQAGFLFGEDLADSAGIIIGPGALVRDAIAPFQRLPVEVLERGEAASGEEGIANIADGAFDPSLLIAATGPARGERRNDSGRTSRGAWDEIGLSCQSAPARPGAYYRIRRLLGPTPNRQKH